MPAGKIDDLLKIWAALLAPHNDEPPFKDHNDLYSTIDATPLPGGDAEWKSFNLCFRGDDLPPDAPNWKKTKWDVWYRDPRQLIHNMLQNPDFRTEFDYTPHQEYDLDGNHRFHNVMSGNWCWREAVSINVLSLVTLTTSLSQDVIAEDPKTHGAMLIPVILGSDKTTVSVAMGQNEYWPAYMSIANIHNNVRRAHRNGVVLLGFLPIPKGKRSKSLLFLIYSSSFRHQEGYEGWRVSPLSSTNLPFSYSKDAPVPQACYG
jgi:hypothetical protein